jgi:DNA polymerase III epsilon subunit-like protein
MINSFLNSVTVIDTETTHVDANQASIVELATAHHIDGEGWRVNSELFSVLGGIPPEASAKNQISNRMLANRPSLGDSMPQVVDMLNILKSYWVAHNANYDRTVLVNNFVRINQPELAQLFAQTDRWICTWRLSKIAYQHSFVDQVYGQNYLRYRLDLPVDDSLGVHRAGDDVRVCAALLERIVADLIDQGQINTNQPIGEQLVTLSNSPITLAVWPLGKHRGRLVSDLQLDYLVWALDNVQSLDERNTLFDPDLLETVRAELERRLLAV